MRIKQNSPAQPESVIPAIAPRARASADGRSAGRQVNPEHGVWLLDEDPGSRKAVCKLLQTTGYHTEWIESAGCLLQKSPPASPTCVVMVNPLKCGSEVPLLIEQMKQRGLGLPVVVIATQWNLKLAVRTIKAGAQNFLGAPADPDDFLDAVEDAMKRAQATQSQQHFIDDATRRIASLNPREKEILALVLSGLLNKEIADHLSLALVTVKVYRARVMKKLGAGNAASMACIAGLGGMNVQAGLTFVDG